MLKYLAVFSFALSACASAPAQTVAPPPPAPKSDVPAPAPPQELTQQQRFDAWKADFTARAIQKEYKADLVRAVINPTKINPLALERDKTQPEFTKPIWSYVDNAASATRLNGGRSNLSDHQALFDQIEERYPSDRHILTAIWGLESAYGQILGTHDIIDSLATFAFEGRRTSFGEAQLFAVLDMLSRGEVRKEQLTGSWAGAMGMTQFIPATFRDYAVDFDNNGNKDLWSNPGDALGSAANYLARHGWRPEEPVMAEVILPPDFDYGLSNGTKRTVAGWTGMGVGPIGGQNWSKQAMFLEAKLLIPAGSKGPTFLTFKNFDVIKKYNNSTSYALGITVLAEALDGKRAIMTPWPVGDEPLSLTDKKDMQRALTSQGFNTGGVDGMIGPNSRKAIRAWQKANNLPADGYVEQKLLQRILAN